MKKLYVVFILFLFVLNLFSQRHDNWWISVAPGLDNDPFHAPYPATFINFNTLPPTITYEDCPFPGDFMKLTMSDQEGNFLFYSNGYKIYHPDGTVMNNGAGITQDTFPSWYPFSPPIYIGIMGLPPGQTH